MRYPPYRTIPFRDSIAEGVSHPLCLVFMWYRAGIAEIPLLCGGGGIAPPLCMLTKGGKGSGRGGGYCTQLIMLRHQKPHSTLRRRLGGQGFSNVPWRKRAFGPGTKHVFLDLFLGILPWGLVYGEGGAPSTVPLQVSSHVLHRDVPLVAKKQNM